MIDRRAFIGTAVVGALMLSSRADAQRAERLPRVALVVAALLLREDQIAGDGESNWLEGVQLLAVYFIIGVLFFFLPAPAVP